MIWQFLELAPGFDHLADRYLEKQFFFCDPPELPPIVSYSGNKAILSLSGFMARESTPWRRGTDEIGKAIVEATDRAKEILLLVDSPGGIAGSSAPIDAAIELVLGKGIPVEAHVIGYGASAAYRAIRKARILAAPDAKVGSLGTAYRLLDFSEAMNRDGIKEHVVASSPLKAAGVATKIEPLLLEHLKHLVNASTAVFRQEVQTDRRLDDAATERVFDARLFVGEEARPALVDEVAPYQPFETATAPPSEQETQSVTFEEFKALFRPSAAAAPAATPQEPQPPTAPAQAAPVVPVVPSQQPVAQPTAPVQAAPAVPPAAPSQAVMPPAQAVPVAAPPQPVAQPLAAPVQAAPALPQPATPQLAGATPGVPPAPMAAETAAVHRQTFLQAAATELYTQATRQLANYPPAAANQLLPTTAFLLATEVRQQGRADLPSTRLLFQQFADCTETEVVQALGQVAGAQSAVAPGAQAGLVNALLGGLQTMALLPGVSAQTTLGADLSSPAADAHAPTIQAGGAQPSALPADPVLAQAYYNAGLTSNEQVAAVDQVIQSGSVGIGNNDLAVWGG